MGKVLSEDAAERFNADGFIYPLRVLSREEAAEDRACRGAHQGRERAPPEGRP